MTLKIELKGLGKVKQFLLRLGADVKEAAREAAREVIREAARLAREKAKSKPEGTFPGNKVLFDSIDSRIEDGQFPIRGAVFIAAANTGVVEFEEEPPGIRSRRKTDFPRQGGKADPIEEKKPSAEAPFKILEDAAREAVGRTGEFLDRAVKRKLR